MIFEILRDGLAMIIKQVTFLREITKKKIKKNTIVDLTLRKNNM